MRNLIFLHKDTEIDELREELTELRVKVRELERKHKMYPAEYDRWFGFYFDPPAVEVREVIRGILKQLDLEIVHTKESFSVREVEKEE